MAIKPILFNTEMVRAILDGRKTCTMRLPKKNIEEKYIKYEEQANSVMIPGGKKLTEKQFYEKFPPYHKFDVLYVRETWCKNPNYSEYYFKTRKPGIAPYGLKWRPSIHMPKEAARIWLHVTDVRLERLQDITQKQTKNEDIVDLFYKDIGYGKKGYDTEIDAEYWNANPLVWVIEFERCEKPKNEGK